MLAEARTIEEILHIENLAQRARDYAKAAGYGLQTANAANRIMLDARRKAGETLKVMKERGELAQRGNAKKLQPATFTLDDIGLNKFQARRYQLEAALPEEDYREWVQKTLDGGTEELTATRLRKLAKQHTAQQATDTPETQEVTSDEATGLCGNLHELAESGLKFHAIYADPPWKYGNQSTRAATDDHYPTMTVEQICAEPVIELADEWCHLYLWTTTSFLQDAFKVIAAWGFVYKSNMVWVKPQMGIGNYVRVSHEHLLIATKGDKRTNGKSQMSWIQADRTKHSRKPREFREVVERMSDGPYLEMYGRERIDGWMVYGNQIEASLFQ